MKHENAHQRGKGDIGGPDLPMNSSVNRESDMQKSMPGSNLSDLDKGYCGEGSIAGATKSTTGKGD
jgi:hypothetical protein